MNKSGNPRRFHALTTLLFVLGGMLQLSAQSVTEESALQFTLPDGVKVTLLEAVEGISHRTNTYYYLPTNLQLSVNDEGVPEFMLMLWSKNNPSKVDDGIMHWLFTWGLSKKQTAILDSMLIARVDSTARLLGAMTVEALEKYDITGDNEALVNLLKRSVNTGGGIPTLPGGKTATSFRFKAEDAPVVAESIKETGKWKGVFIEMPFYYYASAYGHLYKRELVLRLSGEAIIGAARSCKECFIGI